MSLVRNTARAAAEGETGAGLDASAADGGTVATAWTSRALLHHERRRVLAAPDCDRSVEQNPNPPPPCCPGPHLGMYYVHIVDSILGGLLV